MNKFRVLAILITLVVGVPAVYGVDFPRHIDPNLLAIENPDPEALFNIYLNVFDAIITNNYDEAETILGSIENIGALQNVDKELNQYNQLLHSIISNLNQTEMSLQTAYSHLEWRRELQANDSLSQAYALLVSSKSSSQTMDPENIASALNGAPSTLLEGKLMLDDFIEKLNQEIQDGFEVVDLIAAARIEGLTETILTLSCDRMAPWVGTNVTVSGTLTTLNGSPLLDKILEIQLADQSYYSVSDTMGGFSLNMVIPYHYEKSLELNATYWPSSTDFSSYTPSVTSITLEPRYFTPTLNLDLPDYVYPGAQYHATGRVQHQNMPLEVDTSLTGFGISFPARAISDGVYFFRIDIPVSAKTGESKVTLRTQSYDLYGPASLNETLEIKRLPITVNLDTRNFVISGQTVAISGRILTNTRAQSPVDNCTVIVQLGDTKIKTRTDKDGVFTTTFPQKLSSLSIRREFTVEATPQDPWISRVILMDSILVINVVSLIIISIIMIVLIASRKPKEPPIVISPILPESPPIPYDYQARTKLAGVYIKAVRFIEHLSGQYLGPSNTIQEYLFKVKPMVANSIYKLFRQLSGVYERWLYGPKDTIEPVKISESLMRQIIDEEN